MVSEDGTINSHTYLLPFNALPALPAFAAMPLPHNLLTDMMHTNTKPIQKRMTENLQHYVDLISLAYSRFESYSTRGQRC